MTFEDVLNRDGRLVYTNVGVSMLPLIHEGRDVLIIEKRTPSEIKKYDVVLFMRRGIEGRGRYVLHRVLKILPDNQFWIVGDNCIEGETVDADAVLGVLKTVTRGKKSVDFSSVVYRLYVRLWCAPYRLRFFVLRSHRFVKGILRAAVSKLKRH